MSGISRKELHDSLDDVLDDLGYEKNVDMEWGSILIQVQFEKGKIVLKIKERQTERPIP
jgi:hypothetical protein